MNSMIYMFSSLDRRVDIKNQPKYHIIINNVSRFGENYDINEKAELHLKDKELNITLKLKANHLVSPKIGRQLVECCFSNY